MNASRKSLGRPQEAVGEQGPGDGGRCEDRAGTLGNGVDPTYIRIALDWPTNVTPGPQFNLFRRGRLLVPTPVGCCGH